MALYVFGSAALVSCALAQTGDLDAAVRRQFSGNSCSANTGCSTTDAQCPIDSLQLGVDGACAHSYPIGGRLFNITAAGVETTEYFDEECTGLVFNNTVWDYDVCMLDDIDQSLARLDFAYLPGQCNSVAGTNFNHQYVIQESYLLDSDCSDDYGQASIFPTGVCISDSDGQWAAYWCNADGGITYRVYSDAACTNQVVGFKTTPNQCVVANPIYSLEHTCAGYCGNWSTANFDWNGDGTTGNDWVPDTGAAVDPNNPGGGSASTVSPTVALISSLVLGTFFLRV